MRTPRIRLAALLLAALAATEGCRGYRRPIFPMPPASYQPVLDLWLSKNCKVGEDDGLEREMRRFAADLTQPLIAAFEAGPPPERKSAVNTEAQRQLVQTKQRIDSLRLSPNERSRILAQEPQTWAAKAVAEFEMAYKSSALAGLGVVGTPQARARLQQERANSQSPFRLLAGVILARSK